MPAFDPDLPKRLDELMARHVEVGETGGIAWLACRGDEVVTGSAGVLTRGEAAPVERHSLFRIASNTKPLTAVAALLLVEECRLRLEDPVDDLLPELAGRRVLVDPLGPLDGETVPADRPITVRDLLTMQCGLGMDFTAPWPQPPFDRFLQERILDPLGMADTGFSTTATDRLGTSYSVDAETGERTAYDPPDGRWSTPPAFPSGAAGLVSTVDDLAAFGRMLLAPTSGRPSTPHSAERGADRVAHSGQGWITRFS